MRLTIGLTGGSGSGKTTIAKQLAEWGAYVLDADAIARELQQPGKAGAIAMEEAFGSEYFENGELLRPKMASLVFNNPAELSRLNEIMFPLIKGETNKRLQNISGVCIIDAALLYEAGMDAICDRVWVAFAQDDVRLERIMRRDGLSEKQAVERMRSQRNQYPGDETLDTSSGMKRLEPRLRTLFKDAEKLVNAD